MKYITESKRMLFRKLTKSDVYTVTHFFQEKQVHRWLINIPYPYKLSDAQNWIKSVQRKMTKGEILNFAIILKGDKSLIGDIEIRLDKKNNSGEIGYWLGKPYWGQGLMSEALSTFLSYIVRYLHIYRFNAYVVEPNIGSRRVLEKNGFVLEGIQSGFLKLHGKRRYARCCYGKLIKRKRNFLEKNK